MKLEIHDFFPSAGWVCPGQLRVAVEVVARPPALLHHVLLDAGCSARVQDGEHERVALLLPSASSRLPPFLLLVVVGLCHLASVIGVDPDPRMLVVSSTSYFATFEIVIVIFISRLSLHKDCTGPFCLI